MADTDIYTQIRQIAETEGIAADNGTVYRVAGRLRIAHVTSVRQNMELALRELRREMREAREAPDGSTTVKPEAADTFRNIDAGLTKGVCPKCGQPMREVKLADETDAMFCEGECRVTLWAAEDKK